MKGKVDLKNPENTFVLLLDYGEDSNCTKDEPVRMYLGRMVSYLLLAYPNKKMILKVLVWNIFSLSIIIIIIDLHLTFLISHSWGQI